MTDERPLSFVPLLGWLTLAAGLGLQLAWHVLRPPVEARAAALPPAPALESLDLASLGDREALARGLMLWLQAFDTQPGISIPFRDLDYGRVIGWLDRIVDLAPRAHYPFLAASRVYTEVPVEAKSRAMLEFVHRRFFEDPNRRWPWLAHAVYVAKHRLRDLPLALRYAESIATHATGKNVPHWAQQMRIFILEDLGEVEAAKVLLGGLIASGAITDPHELRFLEDRLARMSSAGQGGGRR